MAPQGFKTENEGYITIEGTEKQRFVTQREGWDADVNHVMNKYDLPGGGGSYIADDMSAVSLVMGGFWRLPHAGAGDRNIPFPVDVIPLEVRGKEKTIVLAYVRSDVLAPAVQKMQSYILELSEESRGGAIDYEIQVHIFFDLDGTLWDSREGHYKGVQYALSKMGDRRTGSEKTGAVYRTASDRVFPGVLWIYVG